MKTLSSMSLRSLFFAAALSSSLAHAALTDISNVPLSSTGSSAVKPNLLYVLDNSGSMAWDYMPDNANSPYFSTSTYGYASAQCNGVFYNPDVVYQRPVDATGTNYPASSFTAAPIDGFGTTTTMTIDLSAHFGLGQYTDSSPTNTGGGAAYYYKYTGTQTTQAQQTILNSSSTYFKECNSNIGSTPGSGVFTKVTVSATSGPGGTDERQNFANWYSYYRTRLLMMKSAAGLAFQNIGNSFRVGFTTISDTGVNTDTTCSMSSSNKTFLMIKDFDTPQKTCWYTKFYGTTTSGSTPLRVALAKAGRIYAGKLLTGANDPMQYSCQQNFAIVSTDGYWNETNDPTQIDGTTAVGEQDADEVRPMYDGASVSYTRNTKQTLQSTKVITKTTSQTLQDTQQLQSSTSSLQKVTAQLQQDIGTLQKQTSVLMSSTSNLQSSTMYLQQSTSSNSGSSYGAWTSTSSCKWSTSGKNRTQCRYAVSSSASAATWSAGAATWTDTNSCTTSYKTGTSGTWSGNGTSCQYSDYSTPAPAVGTCTNVAQDTTSPYTVGTATQCSYVDGSWANATSSCTPVAKSASSPFSVDTSTQCQYVWNTAQPAASCSSPTYVAGNYANLTVYSNCAAGAASTSTVTTCTPSSVNGLTTSCSYTPWSAWANASTCTAQAQSASAPYTGPATQCQTTDTGWVGVSGCNASSSGGTVITCQGPNIATANVASCTSQTASSSNQWVSITCNTATTTPVPVASCTAASASSANNYTATICTANNTGPTTVTSCTAQTPSQSNGFTTVTCSAPVISGGTSNSLADVAEYYWRTDLRTPALGNCTGALGTDVCTNNVPGASPDVNNQQHMTTFTLGLGADGTLLYSPNYLTGGSPDFNAIVTGPKNWPDPTITQNATRIDDLWHAAVDGRGVYYSAKNATTLVSGLSSALAGVSARTGSSSAASTSTLLPVAGNNFLYVALYRSVYWDGDVQARTIDPYNGAIGTSISWSAQAQLDSLVANSGYAARTIYTFDPSNANSNYLKPFAWASLTAAEQAYFSNMCTPTALLSQCPTLNASDQATASNGQNLVNYIRGDTTYDGTLYRARSHLLGDIIDSKPQYVAAPPYNYADTGYNGFQSANASRETMVYIGSNDGMVHAFDGQTGNELWAYVPSVTMPNLYHRADMTFGSNHRYTVDGSPVSADICPNAPGSTCTAGQWKTILVGGMNAGGRGLYALDITNPTSPKGLWRFTSANDADLGYTFGNPLVVKRQDGTWVVVIASGYNNVSPGSGQGFLFVLRASDGTLLEKIATGVGSPSSPSGLTKINVWLNTDTDKTATRFYGGDLLGNMWRITLDPNAPANSLSTSGTAFLLATVGQTNGAGTQPITTKPELTLVPYGGVNFVAVEFGTGEYLGVTDLSNTSLQSVYAIKDDLTNTSLGQVRASGVMVQQFLTNVPGTNGAPDTRTVSNNPVDWGHKAGWFVDLDPSNTSPGERVNVDVQLDLGYLIVASNVPSSNACNVGGYNYIYYFNFDTGSVTPQAPDPVTGVVPPLVVGTMGSDQSLVVGMNFIFLQPSPENSNGGAGDGFLLTSYSDGTQGGTAPPPRRSGGNSAKRYSWRELIQ